LRIRKNLYSWTEVPWMRRKRHMWSFVGTSVAFEATSNGKIQRSVHGRWHEPTWEVAWVVARWLMVTWEVAT
jgi:hypothetical protein